MTAFDQPITISSNSDEVLYYANCVDSYYGDFIGYWSFPVPGTRASGGGRSPATRRCG
jgi:hypothetical protein